MLYIRVKQREERLALARAHDDRTTADPGPKPRDRRFALLWPKSHSYDCLWLRGCLPARTGIPGMLAPEGNLGSGREKLPSMDMYLRRYLE